ncbi:hypothetical protein SDC9_138292 [bioreactor metagenome]|uniref:4'-phosphopantetheinyl transferase domain-containing protein n=1 Tax=bioreactor metagenome TaxID=1076179 RepID=A0A645DPI5_9ZZZZ
MINVFWSRRLDSSALLAQALADSFGLSRIPPVVRGKRGKPWFPDFPDVHFNLSHSGPLTLCAVADRPVGADIEEVRLRHEGLPAYTLNEEEYEIYCREKGGWDAFYTLWTRKEAWCKQTGEGLLLPPSRMVIPEGTLLRSYEGALWRAAVCGGEYPPEEATEI